MRRYTHLHILPISCPHLSFNPSFFYSLPCPSFFESILSPPFFRPFLHPRHPTSSLLLLSIPPSSTLFLLTSSSCFQPLRLPPPSLIHSLGPYTPSFFQPLLLLLPSLFFFLPSISIFNHFLLPAQSSPPPPHYSSTAERIPNSSWWDIFLQVGGGGGGGIGFSRNLALLQLTNRTKIAGQSCLKEQTIRKLECS
jgi:hypothetical protein